MWPFSRKKKQPPPRPKTLVGALMSNPMLIDGGQSESSQEVDRILPRLRSDDPRIRLDAVSELGELSPTTLHVLAALGTVVQLDSDDTVRTAAANILRKAGVDPKDVTSYADEAMQRRKNR